MNTSTNHVHTINTIPLYQAQHHLTQKHQSTGRIKRSFNLGSSFQTGYKYRVLTRFPFSVSRHEELDEVTVFDFFDRITYHLCETRLEAEKIRLEALEEHYDEQYKKYLADTSKFKRKSYKFNGYVSVDGLKAKRLLNRYKTELNNLEKDHPEWLI